MRITGFYAALFALLVIGLALRVMLLRRRNGLGLGDGGNRSVACAIRAHGNAAEYVPLALLLMLVLELNQTWPWLLHVFGVALLLARLYHAQGLSKTPGYSPGRSIGAAVTLLVIFVMALLLLWQYIIVRFVAVG